MLGWSKRLMFLIGPKSKLSHSLGWKAMCPQKWQRLFLHHPNAGVCHRGSVQPTPGFKQGPQSICMEFLTRTSLHAQKALFATERAQQLHFDWWSQRLNDCYDRIGLVTGSEELSREIERNLWQPGFICQGIVFPSRPHKLCIVKPSTPPT
jgi:hypothetical protein